MLFFRALGLQVVRLFGYIGNQREGTGVCPNSSSGEHDWNAYPHTNPDGSVVTKTECNCCGMERR